MVRQAIALVALSLAALTQRPDAREALRLGRSQDEALYAAFSRGYTLAASDPVDSAEVITEFRRAVLIVRERARLGEFGFTERDLTVAMTPHLGLVTFIVQARLNPLHTYATAPAYELYIETGPLTPPLAAREARRDPVYALGGIGAPLIGVRLEITIPRAQIEAAPRPELILTDERASVLWRSRIDLSRYR
ncbi:MAG TPA: hypothetical protein VFK57_01840 [Vicinamibacterales bacterium]|nr:hypothetical protein [Vicinamibacterales bacterium]